MHCMAYLWNLHKHEWTGGWVILISRIDWLDLILMSHLRCLLSFERTWNRFIKMAIKWSFDLKICINPVPARFDMNMILLSKASKDCIVRDSWSWISLYRERGSREGLAQLVLRLSGHRLCGVSIALLWVRRSLEFQLVTRCGLVGALERRSLVLFEGIRYKLKSSIFI